MGAVVLSSEVAVGASQHHDVALRIAEPDFAVSRGRVDLRPLEDRSPERAGARDRRVEVADLEPEQDPVAVGPEVGVSQVRMIVGVPGVQLEDERPGRVHELLVLVAAVAARAAEELLVPAAAGRYVANRDQRLGLHSSRWVSAGPTGRSASRSQSTVKMAESGACSARSRSPFLTTTLSPGVKSTTRSRPVRLQTSIESPVSRVHCSHAPFG